jgi:hypothetical protein
VSFSNLTPISIILWSVGGLGCVLLARRRFPILPTDVLARLHGGG